MESITTKTPAAIIAEDINLLTVTLSLLVKAVALITHSADIHT